MSLVYKVRPIQFLRRKLSTNECEAIWICIPQGSIDYRENLRKVSIGPRELMKNYVEHEAALRETISERLAVIVTGTGVSIAASIDPKTKRPHPQASWTGLLENGLRWLGKHNLIEKEVADAHLKLLQKNPSTHRFISAAEDITEQMGGATSPHFADWLKRTVGSIKAHDRSILDALESIRLHGNLLATTNYDGLLLDGNSKLTPVTWKESGLLIGALRSPDAESVIFLHGYWRAPESVVLDWKSYDQIVRDEEYREDLLAFWRTKTWVYVGCGINGLGDPDFNLLLERYGARARQAGHWDYCLVRENQRHEFQAHFDNNNLNIYAISYGADHADLPKYLRSLVPQTKSVASRKGIVTDPKHFDELYRGAVAWDHDSSFQPWSALDLPTIDTFLNKYWVLRQEDFLLGLKPIEQFRRFGFIGDDGNLCRGAFLSFAEIPSSVFTGATTKCFRWHGVTQENGFERDHITRGGLVKQFEETLVFLKQSLRLERRITNKGREETLEIPASALEEVVANALIHRIYDVYASVKVSVFDDRIEVVSPGDLPQPLHISDICSVSNSHPRNPQIARIFYLWGLVETAGSGIQRIKAAMASEDLPPPEFEETSDHCFKVTLRRPSKSDEGTDQKQKFPSHRIGIPRPPELFAKADYIGGHTFVGRRAELDVLNDWARPEDPSNLLLLESIGGNGKSMLTWEWTTNPECALAARPVDSLWAGRFWYSFYEKGTVMADFCRHALAYMTEQPLEEFAKKKTTELAPELLVQLHAHPWLLILDGLERVLVAYHRFYAAEVPDEETNGPTDRIARRNPLDAIREEDNDLLRSLAAAAPSKILISSRLTPRVLQNRSGVSVSGVRRMMLSGLRPPDAESLLRSCGKEVDPASGIRGDSAAIQRYLQANCDNHPLVIGVLGGLINNYLPDRGNFDAWVVDPDRGASLDLARLDLIQRRNHVLRAALEDLQPASHQLLSALALLSDAVDYETLKAFNPHLPPEPEEVRRPDPPEDLYRWKHLPDQEKAKLRDQYETRTKQWQKYEDAVQSRRMSDVYRVVPGRLEATVTDLEQRGLLHYDTRTKRYDLHPVVRSVVAGLMQTEDLNRYGQRVVDHFSSLPHSPYESAETLEELRPGLEVVRTLLKLGRFQEAADAFRGDLANSFLFNIEDLSEVLSLLRPFFTEGWSELPNNVSNYDAEYLAQSAGTALNMLSEFKEGFSAQVAALRSKVKRQSWDDIGAIVQNISLSLRGQNLLAKSSSVISLSLKFSTACDDQEKVFLSQLDYFTDLTLTGRYAEAESTWQALDPMGRNWSRARYRPGDAEWAYSLFQFHRGFLRESHLTDAERLASLGKNRIRLRGIHRLRGAWRLELKEWALAAESFAEALRMARERGLIDAEAETGLALAKHQLGELRDERAVAERLAQFRKPAHRYLSQLWQAIGDAKSAKRHALAAYKWAWADGEPYVRRYELTKTTELLNELKIPVTNLPDYDPAKDEPFPWEADVIAAIETIRAEKEAEGKPDSQKED